jgi:hypothetical protein
MRGLRSTLLLLAVLVGLVGYIYFVESRKPSGPEAGEKKAKAFSVAADKIQELSVKGASGERAVLRKNGTTWEIVEPARVPADESEVSGITSSLGSLEIQRVVDENPGDLKQYGLAQPRVEIDFKAAGDKGSTRLLLGEKTATGGNMYAKLGSEKKVFLVSGYLDSSFNRTPFDLRDKTILKFDRSKADHVEVVSADRTLQFTKTGEEWGLDKPVQSRSDSGSVEGLVSRLQTAQMKSVAAQDATDLKQYGLDKPDLTATIGAGSARATLLIGKKTSDGTLYAKDAARPMVFTVEASLADDLKKPADDYRRKDLFEFRPFTATSLEITRGSETLAYEKTTIKDKAGKTEEKWRQIKPATRDVDSAKMDTLLSKLSNLRAQSFTDPAAKIKTGLDTPAAVVAARFGEGRKEERVTFGKVDSDAFAARPGETGAAKLLASDFDDVIKALDDLKKVQEAKKAEEAKEPGEAKK